MEQLVGCEMLFHRMEQLLGCVAEVPRAPAARWTHNLNAPLEDSTVGSEHLLPVYGAVKS